MIDSKKLAHAIWQCKYHILSRLKYRFRILKGSIGRTVKEIITQLCEWKQLEILEISVGEDHVHLVLSISPKFAVSETIGFLKGKCAIKVFDKHLELKKEVLITSPTDYIMAERGWQDHQQLHAAGLGLGAHDHWEGFATKRYSLIDHIQADLVADPRPTPPPNLRKRVGCLRPNHS